MTPYDKYLNACRISLNLCFLLCLRNQIKVDIDDRFNYILHVLP